MITTWKGDYFYILPCLCFYNDKEELYLKLGWGKWFLGIGIIKRSKV